MRGLKGFRTFMGKVFDIPAMGVLALGAVLPAAGTYLYNKVTMSSMVPSSVSNFMSGTYTKPAALIVASSGIAYLASRYGLVSSQTAVAAATLSTFLYVAGAVKNSGLLDSVPVVRDTLPSLNGIGGGYLGGYRGGYLGYLGGAHDSAMNPMHGAHNGMMLYGDADAGTDQAQLFGVGSAPKVNVF